MKRKHILIASVALMATSFLESCSDEFLQDKKNYDYASPQDAYNNYSGALARVNDIYKFIMPDHIKASIELLFHKTPAMKFPPISMSGFQSIYHFTVNAHCTHFLPGAPLTAGSGAFIFVKLT